MSRIIPGKVHIHTVEMGSSGYVITATIGDYRCSVTVRDEEAEQLDKAIHSALVPFLTKRAEIFAIAIAGQAEPTRRIKKSSDPALIDPDGDDDDDDNGDELEDVSL